MACSSTAQRSASSASRWTRSRCGSRTSWPSTPAPSATGAARPSSTRRRSTSCSTAECTSSRSSRSTPCPTSTACSRRCITATSSAARSWFREGDSTMNAPAAPYVLKNHDLAEIAVPGVRVEKLLARMPDGKAAAGLYNAWIWLDNPSQFNSYTTEIAKGVILAFPSPSNARDVNCVVFTGVGDKAFCTGGNTKEYAEYYAGHPQEYRQYMRLFNDMVSAILACDKPVVCRVNGMRVGGGQEIGMACDFSIAQDLARFGQAGPKHGSAPIGGATDFLPVVIGTERAMVACVLCEPFSAHEAYFMGMLSHILPGLKVDGEWTKNPLVWTDESTDAYGRSRHGEPKTGEALAHWDRNRETNRAWLSLNMMTEANAGFRAFNEGDKEGREVDFVSLRRRLAEGERWSEELIQAVHPRARRKSSA